MLDLIDNQIVDLKPLAGLNNLEILNLDGNKIADLKPLTKLNKLIFLQLSNNADRYLI
ncbi:leucine-rich repeat domain-containing protein [Chamaesiphon sp. OTE_75_metabat_556]|uniref:leucine-rich repeat domain-containing protein n=1 Tax=Chamaesiphon sp. OTE_75_metabat_556 TaxID=2964692 RepID=UPI00286D48E4|nr:leucine-rich repeat domain-containing protein [Chamaesiphon sp. OTE_75_metabat_556]